MGIYKSCRLSFCQLDTLVSVNDMPELTIAYADLKRPIRIKNGPNWWIKTSSTSNPTPYDALVVATPIGALQTMGINTASSVCNEPNKTNESPARRSLISQPSKTAIRGMHTANASKFYIQTKTAFWEEKDSTGQFIYPRNFQTDELFRQSYSFTYNKNSTEAVSAPDLRPATQGVVLMSYVWEDDSIKEMTLSKNQRYEYFMDILSKANPVYAAKLRQETISFSNQNNLIDWQLEIGYFGAFRLNYSAQEFENSQIFFQYKDALNLSNPPIALAGESITCMGGWVENSIISAINAVCAVAERLSPNSVRENSPLTKISPLTFNYKTTNQII